MTVGIGIVGLGRWAGAHAAAAARTDSVRLASCFSRDETRRTEFATTHGVDRVAASYDDLLDDPAVEAVVIASPNNLHVDMAIAAIDAGKPVLVDKPVSVDIESGLALLRAVQSDAPRAQVGVAHHPRRLAGLRAARRWLESADAGTPRLAHADFSNARGAHMNPDAWQRRVRGSEAGVLIQVGIHQVDNMLALLGPAAAVNARFAHQTLGHLPDAVVVVMQHTSGAISTVSSSWTTPGLHRFEIQTTAANLRYRLDHSKWTSPDVDAHSSLFLQRDGEADQPVDMVASDPLAEQLDELAASTQTPGAMEVDVATGLRAMTVVLAAVESADKRGVEVDLARFLRDAGASGENVDLLVGPTASA